MCQLLGMNCNVPTDICFSFEGFSARGGKTDNHSDGWGIAFFEGNGCRVFLDDKPSIESPVSELVRSYPIRSINAIAHIRKATHGEVALVNTHPFQRELWGNYWVFAHNGELKNFQPTLSGTMQPVGTTDSEYAFCYLMGRLRQRYGDIQPPMTNLYQTIHDISCEIAQFGIFNFLLSNGDFLFAYSSTSLYYIERKAPFTTAHLLDEDISIDFNKVASSDDRVTVVATTPLTDNEEWTKIALGKLVVFREGNKLNWVDRCA